MKSILFLFSTFLFAITGYDACDKKQVETKVEEKTVIEICKEMSQATLERNNLPGLVVAVKKDGEMLWAEGFGYENMERGITANPYTSKFRIGSVSKPFTATALGLLYEEGRLDLDERIQAYVSYFPDKEHEITIRQVGGHIAGIRHYNGKEFLSIERYNSVEESMNIFKNDPLLFKPGEKYAYSSYGWNLLSAVVEGTSGQDFLYYMRRNVFKRMDMFNTGAFHVDEDIPNRTVYYELKNNIIVEAPFVDNSYKWAGGGFESTAEDLTKFAQAYYNGFLKQNTIEEFWTPLKTNDGKSTGYGIGWSNQTDTKGRKWVGHSGGSVGGTTMLLMYPEHKLTVAVISNLTGAKFENLPFKIADLFLEEKKNN